jgi:hypothetical protein
MSIIQSENSLEIISKHINKLSSSEITTLAKLLMDNDPISSRYLMMELSALDELDNTTRIDNVDGSKIETTYYKNGVPIRYIINSINFSLPKYVLIIMPGGIGTVNPTTEDGYNWIHASGNFLLRSRNLFLDNEIITASTDATRDVNRMNAIVNDICKKYLGAKIYIVGNSRSTISSMLFAKEFDNKVTGFIHVSPMNDIANFDTTKFKSRHLIVHHNADACQFTPYSSAEQNHKKYGTELITMTGGQSKGSPCEAFSYHGFFGIEKETVTKIKKWILNE